MVGIKYGVINQRADCELPNIKSVYNAKNSKNNPIPHPISPTAIAYLILRSLVLPI